MEHQEEKEIDISSLNKAEVLAALYNRAKPLGMGFLHYTPEDMTILEAQALLDTGQTYFDYLKGRVMKVRLNEDVFNPRLYDIDNGYGAALDIINTLKTKK